MSSRLHPESADRQAPMEISCGRGRRAGLWPRGRPRGVHDRNDEGGLSMQRLVLSVPLATLTAGSALAASVLTTPPVNHQTGEVLVCVAVNVGKVNRNMKADVMEFFSDVPLDSEQASTAPGEPVSASGDGNYCRFTVDNKK